MADGLLTNGHITLNFPFKIRFSDGEEMNIVIFENHSALASPKFPFNHKVCYWCNKTSPFAKALLGHYIGEKIKYASGDLKQEIEILGF